MFKKKYLKHIKNVILNDGSGRETARHAFAVFDEIVNKTGSTVVIDSSKKLTNLIAYNKYVPRDWEIKVLHIYRDPEATALSVQKAGHRLGIQKDQSYFKNLIKCVHYNSLIKCYLRECEHFPYR